MKEQHDVREFMEACGQPSSEGTWDYELSELYLRLIDEEKKELEESFLESDFVKVADGVADLAWVLLGFCNAIGLNMDDLWYEVRKSNNTKITNQKVRADGKIQKGKDYKKPNFATAIPEQFEFIELADPKFVRGAKYSILLYGVEQISRNARDYRNARQKSRKKSKRNAIRRLYKKIYMRLFRNKV